MKNVHEQKETLEKPIIEQQTRSGSENYMNNNNECLIVEGTVIVVIIVRVMKRMRTKTALEGSRMALTFTLKKISMINEQETIRNRMKMKWNLMNKNK